MDHLATFRRSVTAFVAVALLALAGIHAQAAERQDLVNINTAGVEELASLPRIGPSIAQRIIAYREANGPFKRPAELMNVKGVGEKMFMGLKDRITTGNEKKS